MQKVALVHETLDKCGFDGPGGLGLGTTDQEAPSQRSTKIRWSTPPESPTAKQDVGLMHAAARKMLPIAPDGLATGRTDQVEPFQRWTCANPSASLPTVK